MQKDTNVKETFTLRVKRDIIKEIDVNDNLIFIFILLLQSDIYECSKFYSFQCDLSDFEFYLNNFSSLSYLDYSITKNKVNLKLNKVDLNLFDDEKKDVKSKVINYIISKNKVREYIKFNFILYGSISNPTDYYHLELKMVDDVNCYYFVNFTRKFELNFKYIKRTNGHYIYIKEADKVADFLRIIESSEGLLEFENLRVFKEVRNDINRKQNCEIANLNKVISTAIKQEKAINYINETVGLDYLSDELKEIYIIRLETENLTLQEIGELTNPKIKKSKVNYRFKKIIDISDRLRRQKNDKS